MNTQKFNKIVETAKSKTQDLRWLRAITKAAEGILSGELIVTTLAYGALVTSPNGSYMVNGHCECKAAYRGHSECYHRAAARLVEMMEAETARPAVSVRVPTITRSVEFDRSGARVRVTRCDNWII